MTAIAYDGNQLAVDGRVTYNDVVVTDSYIKLHHLKSARYLGDTLLTIAISGKLSDADKLICYLNGDIEELGEHQIGAIIIGEQYAYELECDNKWLIRYPLDTKLACGSGASFALSALSLGLNARKAVQHAIKHVSSCGGKIITWTR